MNNSLVIEGSPGNGSALCSRDHAGRRVFVGQRYPSSSQTRPRALNWATATTMRRAKQLLWLAHRKRGSLCLRPTAFAGVQPSEDSSVHGERTRLACRVRRPRRTHLFVPLLDHFCHSLRLVSSLQKLIPAKCLLHFSLRASRLRASKALGVGCGLAVGAQ